MQITEVHCKPLYETANQNTLNSGNENLLEYGNQELGCFHNRKPLLVLKVAQNLPGTVKFVFF